MTTISDGELWGCARQQVAQHGDDAATQAAMRSDAFFADGDLTGQKTWLAIVNQINLLTVAGEGEVRH